jgi:hypothetical protein
MSASRHASVKVSADFADAARREAAIFNRSLGGQIEYWAQLGRAIESAGFSVERVREALEGRFQIERLTESERDAFFDLVGERFDRPAAAVADHYAAMRQEAGLVGDDAAGRRVVSTGGGRFEPAA